MYKFTIYINASFSITDMKNIKYIAGNSCKSKSGAGFVKVFTGKGCFNGSRRARKSGEKVHVKRANMINAMVKSVSVKDETVRGIGDGGMSRVILSGAGLNSKGVHIFYGRV
jgi:hypothetical protein